MMKIERSTETTTKTTLERFQIACLVPDGVRIEWHMDGDEWTISGDSLCVGVEQVGEFLSGDPAIECYRP